MTSDFPARTIVAMDTFVTIQAAADAADAVERAFEWFFQIEDCCSRFDPHSELAQLTAQIGAAVPVSAILFEAVQFALAVAEESGGAFDPTIGYEMERRGFNREHRSGQVIRTALEPDGRVSYRDVSLDRDERTVRLLRPLLLDLGSVAKGLAVDLAARELHHCAGFAIDAGGDLYLGGCRPDGAPWSVGIRHPRHPERLLGRLRVSDRAVCSSGDYERKNTGGHHLLDPRSGTPAHSASVTVVAPTAMVADALATAAFVLGPGEGIGLLDRHGVDGLIVSPDLECHATAGFDRTYSFLQNAEGLAHDRPDHPAGDGNPGRGDSAGCAGSP